MIKIGFGMALNKVHVTERIFSVSMDATLSIHTASPFPLMKIWPGIVLRLNKTRNFKIILCIMTCVIRVYLNIHLIWLLRFRNHSSSNLFLKIFLLKKFVFDKFLPLMITEFALPILEESSDGGLLVPGLLVFMLDTKVAFLGTA